MSKYENYVAAALKFNGILYETEKTFDTLKQGKLRFDFYLPNTNTLIEVQGEQHYQFISCFYKNRLDFKKSQGRDMNKISWCLANGYKLYVVPYWHIHENMTLAEILNPCHLALNRYKNLDDWTSYTSQKTVTHK